MYQDSISILRSMSKKTWKSLNCVFRVPESKSDKEVPQNVKKFNKNLTTNLKRKKSTRMKIRAISGEIENV